MEYVLPIENQLDLIKALPLICSLNIVKASRLYCSVRAILLSCCPDGKIIELRLNKHSPIIYLRILPPEIPLIPDENPYIKIDTRSWDMKYGLLPDVE